MYVTISEAVSPNAPQFIAELPTGFNSINIGTAIDCARVLYLPSLSAAMTTPFVAAEAFNSAVERLCDRVTREKDPFICETKDMAAGAVLIAAITAVVIGIIIFGPKVLSL